MPAASAAVASEFVNAYVSVLALITTKCDKVNSSEASLVAACQGFKDGIKDLKDYVESLDSILPNQEDLSPLKSISTYEEKPDKLVEVWHRLMREGDELVRGLENGSKASFPDDEEEHNIFSPLRTAETEKRLAEDDPSYPDPISVILDHTYNLLVQTRSARRQMSEYHQIIKWTLSACLVPQLILLLLLLLQFLLHKRRQTKLRKKIRRAEEAQELMSRVRRQVSGREPSRFIEV